MSEEEKESFARLMRTSRQVVSEFTETMLKFADEEQKVGLQPFFNDLQLMLDTAEKLQEPEMKRFLVVAACTNCWMQEDGVALVKQAVRRTREALMETVKTANALTSLRKILNIPKNSDIKVIRVAEDDDCDHDCENCGQAKTQLAETDKSECGQA